MSGALALVALGVVILVVTWPFIAARRPAISIHHAASADLRRRSDLLAARNRLYRTLQELDFDHETGKIADADYAAARHRLVAQGVSLLQQLDALPAPPEDDPIEAAVGALRGKKA